MTRGKKNPTIGAMKLRRSWGTRLGPLSLQDAGGLGVLGVELGDLDFFGEAELLEKPDAVVVDVELVPGEAMARGDGMGVVVVVPALAAGDEGDPPVVAGVVAGFEAAGCPTCGWRS